MLAQGPHARGAVYRMRGSRDPMTWLDQRQIADLLREAARRGSLRARELAEGARESYATGPRSRRVPAGLVSPLYFAESIRAYDEGTKRTARDDLDRIRRPRRRSNGAEE